MRPALWCAAALLPFALAGCLELDQHPDWIRGQYAGKPDNRQADVLFHGDRLAWAGALDNRQQKQNEYNRANP